jgi:hypothetical protein
LAILNMFNSWRAGGSRQEAILNRFKKPDFQAKRSGESGDQRLSLVTGHTRGNRDDADERGNRRIQLCIETRSRNGAGLRMNDLGKRERPEVNLSPGSLRDDVSPLGSNQAVSASSASSLFQRIVGRCHDAD